MPQAYIVLARNDLDDSLLQLLDLKPPSTKSQGMQVFDGVTDGQTGYLTHLVQNDTVATTDVAGRTTDAVYYGLSAYIIDNVENGLDDDTLTDAQVAAVASAILLRAATGLGLSLAQINTAINSVAGVSAADLDGTASASTGTVEELLRVLAGEVYRLPAASAVSIGANNNFPGGGSIGGGHTRAGAFVATPNVSFAADVPSGGRRSGTVLPPGNPTQTGTQDLTFRNRRRIEDVGSLHASMLNGALSKMTPATFAFQNPAFTYNGGATPATDINGTNIGANFQGRAVVVYDATGAVIS